MFVVVGKVLIPVSGRSAWVLVWFGSVFVCIFVVDRQLVGSFAVVSAGSSSLVGLPLVVVFAEVE